MNELELTGRARSHIVELTQPRCALHYEAVTSFLAMRDAAACDGIDLTPRSSFRDFDTQLGIWNRKWAGERPLYDRHGALLERGSLDDAQTVEAILAGRRFPAAAAITGEAMSTSSTRLRCRRARASSCCRREYATAGNLRAPVGMAGR